MSSTDEAALLRRFFESQLVPAAKALRDRGVRFFPLGPEPEADTWYEPPPDAEPEFVEIEPEAFAAELRTRWAREGLPELAALAEPLMALAREVEVGEDESAEVSPFVYVLY